MASMELGLSTTAFLDFDPPRHLPLMARFGIHCVELSTDCFDRLNAAVFRHLAAAIQDAGVAVNSIHVPYCCPGQLTRCSISDTDMSTRQQALDMAGVCLERLQALGGRCLVLHPSGDCVADDERQERIDLLQEGLLQLLARLPETLPMRIGVESLHKTSLGRDARDLVEIVDAVGSSRVGICLDTNHANLIENIVDATRVYGPRLLTLHISDNDGAAERHWLPMRGVIPWQEWMRALAKTGYSGPLVYEVSAREAADRSLSDEDMLAEIRRNGDCLLSWAQPLTSRQGGATQCSASPARTGGRRVAN